MFKITPIQDEATRRDYARACGVSLHDGSFVYGMVDGEDGHLMGLSQFEILGASGMLFDLAEAGEAHDFEAMFILGRATMNFIDLCGTHICRALPTAANDSMLRALGFKQVGELYEVDMRGMFDGHCSGHKAT